MVVCMNVWLFSSNIYCLFLFAIAVAFVNYVYTLVRCAPKWNKSYKYLNALMLQHNCNARLMHTNFESILLLCESICFDGFVFIWTIVGWYFFCFILFCFAWFCWLIYIFVMFILSTGAKNKTYKLKPFA